MTYNSNTNLSYLCKFRSFSLTDNCYFSARLKYIFKCTDRGASTFYFKIFVLLCVRVSFGLSPRLLKASTNLNQIFTHDFYLDNLSQVQKWASQVTCNTPPLTGGLPPPSKLTYLFQPIQSKFPHMTFDWNSSSEFKNGHHRSNVTPLIGSFCPREKCLWTR